MQGGVTGAGSAPPTATATVSDGIVTTVNPPLAAVVRGGGALGRLGPRGSARPEVRRLGGSAAPRSAGEAAAGRSALNYRFRLPPRRTAPGLLSATRSDGRLVTPGFDLTAQAALPGGEGGHGAFVAGPAVTVGFMNVRYFHL